MTLKKWRVRASDGHPEEWVEADYDEDELDLMAKLRAVVDTGSEDEKREALNTIDTIHEAKVLLDARIVKDEPKLPPGTARCPFCAKAIFPDQEARWEVIGWEADRHGKGGLHALELRRRTGSVSHADCVEKAKTVIEGQLDIMDML